MDLNASWVSDENWSVTTELPTDTDHLLTVTFYYDNGRIELATFEVQYRTGIYSTEYFQVSAEQFDTKRWDADADGISNFNELLAGSDPLFNEVLSVDLNSFVTLPESVFITESFSRRIPSERPYNYNFDIEELPVDCELNCQYYSRNIHNIAIDIDEYGNGVFYDFHRRGSASFYSNASLNANATNSSGSINWEGSWSFSKKHRDEWGESIRFSNTVSAIDESTRSYAGSTYHSGGADYRDFSYATEHNITGRVIEDTELCEPVDGIIITNATFLDRPSTTTTITKNAYDSFWQLEVILTDVGTLVREYLVASLAFRLWIDEGWDALNYPTITSEPQQKFHCGLMVIGG